MLRTDCLSNFDKAKDCGHELENNMGLQTKDAIRLTPPEPRPAMRTTLLLSEQAHLLLFAMALERNELNDNCDV